MITPSRRVGTAEDQENVIFLAPGSTVKLCGGPVGAGKGSRIRYTCMGKYKGAYLSMSSIRQLLLVT